MDSKYEIAVKQPTHERNELRKYIIDICKLLDINTNQFVLGANCLEFYAVLCSTAENKIGELQERLKRKEQECEKLKRWKKGAENLFKTQIDNTDKITNRYKQALDEIEEIAGQQCNICEELTPINEYKDCKKCWQGVILQKISEVENE